VFLTPRENDPIADHGLLGPTYFEALAWEGERFRLNYENWLGRTFRVLIVRMQHYQADLNWNWNWNWAESVIGLRVMAVVAWILHLLEFMNAKCEQVLRRLKLKSLGKDSDFLVESEEASIPIPAPAPAPATTIDTGETALLQSMF